MVRIKGMALKIIRTRPATADDYTEPLREQIQAEKVLMPDEFIIEIVEVSDDHIIAETERKIDG